YYSDMVSELVPSWNLLVILRDMDPHAHGPFRLVSRPVVPAAPAPPDPSCQWRLPVPSRRARSACPTRPFVPAAPARPVPSRLLHLLAPSRALPLRLAAGRELQRQRTSLAPAPSIVGGGDEWVAGCGRRCSEAVVSKMLSSQQPPLLSLSLLNVQLWGGV
ncbi:unnamed protein product, partial [Closterium sp. NIES-53]